MQPAYGHLDLKGQLTNLRRKGADPKNMRVLHEEAAMLGYLLARDVFVTEESEETQTELQARIQKKVEARLPQYCGFSQGRLLLLGEMVDDVCARAGEFRPSCKGGGGGGAAAASAALPVAKRATAEEEVAAGKLASLAGNAPDVTEAYAVELHEFREFLIDTVMDRTVHHLCGVMVLGLKHPVRDLAQQFVDMVRDNVGVLGDTWEAHCCLTCFKRTVHDFLTVLQQLCADYELLVASPEHVLVDNDESHCGSHLYFDEMVCTPAEVKLCDNDTLVGCGESPIDYYRRLVRMHAKTKKGATHHGVLPPRFLTFVELDGQVWSVRSALLKARQRWKTSQAAASASAFVQHHAHGKKKKKNKKKKKR